MTRINTIQIQDRIYHRKSDSFHIDLNELGDIRMVDIPGTLTWRSWEFQSPTTALNATCT